MANNIYANGWPHQPIRTNTSFATGLQDNKKRTVPVRMPQCAGLGTMGTASGACPLTVTKRPGGAPLLFLHSSAAGGVDYTKASGLNCTGQTPPRETPCDVSCLRCVSVLMDNLSPTVHGTS